MANITNGFSSHHGVEVLRNPRTNKGLAFSLEERKALGIDGLLPPVVQTQDEQAALALVHMKDCKSDLDRYIYLMELATRNEKLFYRILIENIMEMMPIVYTPVVGLACQNYGLILRNSQGLYISINDAGHIFEKLGNWPEPNVKAICVTDGERILGLGDLGTYGMGIPVGKLCLYTACAGIAPDMCLPITLDVGTNTEVLLKDPLYTGLRQKRVTGDKYFDFLEEFMTSVVKRYGEHILIQFEDFGNHNAFQLINKYRDRFCTFNDDIQGTAAVVVAGLISSCRITGKALKDQKFLFQGAGEAALGIAGLLVAALKAEGLSEADAILRVWLVDSKGLIVKDRPKGGLTPFKEIYAHSHPVIDTLEQAVVQLKPTAIIGVAAIPGAFTIKLIKDMAALNKRPIIFALSNPTSKAECTALEAYNNTDGRCVFASGSPFDPVTIGDRTLVPGQGNNAYVFPAICLAVVACKIHPITDGVFLTAAKMLASIVTEDEIAKGLVYPPLPRIQEVSMKIATAIAEYAYKEKIAHHAPEPQNKQAYIESLLYSTKY